MTDNKVQILLVEDNPNDVKLALHAFKRHTLANQIHVVRDGVEALDFLFCTGAYAHRQLEDGPQRGPAGPETAVGRRRGGAPAHQGRPADPSDPGRGAHLLAGGTRPRGELRLGVNSYIVKPVDFDQFIEVVRHLGSYWLLLNQHPVRGGSDAGE